MEATAHARFIRYTPRKVAQVAGLIRGKNVQAALTALQFASRRAANPIAKTLNSAIANLKVKARGRAIEPKELRVSKITVDQGPVLKRIHPGSMGRAMPFKRKMCHLTVAVTE